MHLSSTEFNASRSGIPCSGKPTTHCLVATNQVGTNPTPLRACTTFDPLCPVDTPESTNIPVSFAIDNPVSETLDPSIGQFARVHPTNRSGAYMQSLINHETAVQYLSIRKRSVLRQVNQRRVLHLQSAILSSLPTHCPPRYIPVQHYSIQHQPTTQNFQTNLSHPPTAIVCTPLRPRLATLHSVYPCVPPRLIKCQ
jgi:hypothetical protein